MTRRVPILATLIVLAAVAAMIGLGLWQLHRAAWKESLLRQYAAAAGRPVLPGLPRDAAARPDVIAFRRVALRCAPFGALVQIGGRPRGGGAMGYRQISPCRLVDGRVAMVDLGWLPPASIGRSVAGAGVATITGIGTAIPDPELARRVLTGLSDAVPILIVLDTPRALKASLPPSIADIPNNHRGYAVQWFLFAGVAAIIYLLALRRRGR